MKRLAFAVLTVFVAVSSHAAETRRYLVATRHPLRAVSIQSMADEVDRDIVPRGVASLDSFTGFAATLTESEAAELQRSGEVRWIEPVVERHALTLRNVSGQTLPYGVSSIRAPQTWPASSRGVINVVVIDTGVDYHHPELKDIWAGGWNVIASNNDPLDDNGHGTHVAGTIAAADNNSGVVGVAPHARLWSVKVLDSAGHGSSENVIKAVDWIISQKAKLGGDWVANLSLGSTEESPGEREAFQRGADAGIIFVAASGNESTSTVVAPVGFPAAYPSVLAIGAIDANQKLATFTSQGPELDLAAPGVGILSTVPLGQGAISYVMDGGSVYEASALTGSKLGSVTGEYVFCGYGRPEDFPSAVSGRIALIQRGPQTDDPTLQITFAQKAQRAKEAGATAVAIFNYDDSTNGWTLLSATTPTTYEWPLTLRLSKADGETLAARRSGTITLTSAKDDYAELSGTSMASPHVAGAVALLWSLAPNATPETLINALKMTAYDLGAPGVDNEFGAGEVNVYAAAMMLAPDAFSTTHARSGRPFLRRSGRH